MLGIGLDLNEIPEYGEGFDLLNVENPLYPNYLESDYAADIEKVKAGAKGRLVVIDGPYIDLNPGSPEKAVRELTSIKVDQGIEFSRACGALEVIFLSTFLPMINLSVYELGWLTESAKFWKEKTEKYPDIRISICNTFEYTPDILLRLVKNVGAENFGLACDIGHVLVFGRTSVQNWLSRVYSQVNTIYLHSNDGTGDQHLNFQQGFLLNQLSYSEIAELGKEKNLILKQFDKTGIRESAQILRGC